MDKPQGTSRDTAGGTGGTSTPLGERVRTVAEWLPLLVVALFTTLYHISRPSLWADEGNSAAQALRPLPEIIRRAAMDIHPPLYYILLHGWTRVFGTGEWGLRSLSALAGIGVVLLVWALARVLWGRTTAWVVGVLAAFHPLLVYYAQEARMYMLLTLWGTLAAYALMRLILEEGRARRGGRRTSPQHPALQLGFWDGVYALAIAAGLWTHYAFPVIPLTLAGLYLLWVWTTRRTIPVMPRVIRFLADHLAALALFMPWLPVALARVRAWPHPQDVLSLEEGVLAALRMWAWGPLEVKGNQPWLWVWMALLLVALWPWRRWTRIGYRRPHWLSWGLPLAWLGTPLLLLGLLHLFRPAYLKFLLIGLPPFLILLARGILAPAEAWQKAPRRFRVGAWAWAAFTLILLLLLQGRTLLFYYTHPSQVRDDYRGMVRYIQAVGTGDDAVILNAPGQWDVFCYYYPGCDLRKDIPEAGVQEDPHLPAVYPLPLERPPNPSRVISRLTDIARTHHTLFVLLWATGESDPEGVVEQWLDSHTYKALDVWRGHVRFLIYATPRPLSESALIADVGARLGEVVTLERFALLNPEVHPGDVVQVSLVWKVLRSPQRRYKVFVQVLGPNDRLIAQRDSEPLGGSSPTDRWQPGERVEDHYGVLIPLGTPPGSYRLITGMYDAQTGERLPVVWGEKRGDFVELPTRIRVMRPSTPPPEDVLPIRHWVKERWGPIELLGYNRYKRGYAHAPETPLRPGDFLHVTLFWKALRRPQARWRVTLSLVDGWGNVVASVTDDPAGPTYPTPQWTAGEVVRGEFDLYIPPTVKPGTYGLQIQMWKGENPVREPMPLGVVKVGG
ncbi:MAG: hypothetical protein GXO55_00540 [Chloroflexi bacterium]|nr:hypothetical protein [Chloroflexota bacterium]